MSELEIKDSTRSMTDLLKKNMTLNDAGIVEVNPDTFQQTLEMANIDESDYNRVHNHNVNVFNAAALALGEIAVPAMKKDKSLDKVTVVLPALKAGTISHAIERESIFRDKKRGSTVVYGAMTSSFNNNLGRDQGDLKKIRTHIAEQAKEAFGCKI